MFNCCSHGALLHFGLQSSHLNICYYHQDLHRRLLHPGSRPRLLRPPPRPSYSSPHSAPNRYGPPPEFPLASTSSGIVHHLSGPDTHALARPLRQADRIGR
ncbi:unnamed protein product [Clavelina lepadiformis]|uniref:Uncharacterized protein n=1 Tax=Clavelina lepadiformis TaxID=159417 RepID=A0ABP0F9C2_CLALP